MPHLQHAICAPAQSKGVCARTGRGPSSKQPHKAVQPIRYRNQNAGRRARDGIIRIPRQHRLKDSLHQNLKVLCHEPTLQQQMEYLTPVQDAGQLPAKRNETSCVNASWPLRYFSHPCKYTMHINAFSLIVRDILFQPNEKTLTSAMSGVVPELRA